MTGGLIIRLTISPLSFPPAKNGVGVTLASGWWSEAQTFTVKNFNYFGDKEALLARIVLTYEDGSIQERVSGAATGNISAADLILMPASLPESILTRGKRRFMKITRKGITMTANGKLP